MTTTSKTYFNICEVVVWEKEEQLVFRLEKTKRAFFGTATRQYTYIESVNRGMIFFKKYKKGTNELLKSVF